MPAKSSKKITSVGGRKSKVKDLPEITATITPTIWEAESNPEGLPLQTENEQTSQNELSKVTDITNTTTPANPAPENYNKHKSSTIIKDVVSRKPFNSNVSITAPHDAVERFKSQLAGYERQILPQLLEAHGISPAQFIQVVLSEVKKNEKLLNAFIANPSSMFASILAGAEIGLMPSEMIGEFFLIPRKIKQPKKNPNDRDVYLETVTPLIGYKGLVSILLRSGDITRIHTEVVYEGDKFEPIYGLEPNIVHIPNFEKPRTAEKIKYAYAVAKHKNGEYQFAVMTRAEIEAVRNMAKYENDLYFNDKNGINRWMERKTILIQLSKMLPKDYYSKKAITMDGMLQAGASLTLDEKNNVTVVENKESKPSKLRDIYGTLNRIKNQ